MNHLSSKLSDVSQILLTESTQQNHIVPKENKSLSLKDHRFKQMQDCALSLLYHLDNIGEYLTKFSNISNDIKVLDRTFAEMEVLKPIFAAIPL